MRRERHRRAPAAIAAVARQAAGSRCAHDEMVGSRPKTRSPYGRAARFGRSAAGIGFGRLAAGPPLHPSRRKTTQPIEQRTSDQSNRRAKGSVGASRSFFGTVGASFPRSVALVADAGCLPANAALTPGYAKPRSNRRKPLGQRAGAVARAHVRGRLGCSVGLGHQRAPGGAKHLIAASIDCGPL